MIQILEDTYHSSRKYREDSKVTRPEIAGGLRRDHPIIVRNWVLYYNKYVTWCSKSQRQQYFSCIEEFYSGIFDKELVRINKLKAQDTFQRDMKSILSDENMSSFERFQCPDEVMIEEQQKQKNETTEELNSSSSTVNINMYKNKTDFGIDTKSKIFINLEDFKPTEIKTEEAGGGERAQRTTQRKGVDRRYQEPPKPDQKRSSPKE